MALSLNLTAQGGTVSGTDARGRAWDVTYQGFSTPFAVWAAVNADGFYLAPGAVLSLIGPTEVVRA